MAHRRLVPAAALLVAAPFALVGCGSKTPDNSAAAPAAASVATSPAAARAYTSSGGCKILTLELAKTVLPSAHVPDAQSIGQACSYPGTGDAVKTQLVFGYTDFPRKSKPGPKTVYKALESAAQSASEQGYKSLGAIGDAAYSTDAPSVGGTGRDAKVEWRQGKRLYGLTLHNYPKSMTGVDAALVSVATKIAAGSY